MAYAHKDGSGALFRNNKGDNASRPDYRGNCMVDGRVYEISAWVKDGAKGKFMSLSFRPPRDQQASPPQRQQPRRQPDDLMEEPAIEIDPNDIPF